MIKILYLTFLEVPFNNPIYKSQVKELLCTLKKKYGSSLVMLYTSFIPFVTIFRKRTRFNFFEYRKEKNKMESQLKKNNINFKLLPIFFPMLARWRIYNGAFTLPLIIIVSLPLMINVIAKYKPDIIHCRSYPAALIALLSKWFGGRFKIVFDMRGLFPEEAIATNRWTDNSISYKIWKRIELKLLQKSDKIIVFSKPFRNYLLSLNPQIGSKIEIIPACIDVNVFGKTHKLNGKYPISKDIRYNNMKNFIYHGGLNAWHNPVLLALIFNAIKKKLPSSYLIVLTSFDNIKLKKIFEDNGLTEEDFFISHVNFKEIPHYLSLAHYAIIPSTFNKLENTPVKFISDTMTGLKVSECLASGLPLIANKNIGGVKAILEESNLGILFDFNDLDKIFGNIQLLEEHYDEISSQCVSFAKENFDLESAATKYYTSYKEITKK